MEKKQKRMLTLVKQLNKAQKDYVAGVSKMTDEKYNKAMLELVKLEFELGTKLENSPTQADGFITSLEMLKELSNGKGDDDK